MYSHRWQREFTLVFPLTWNDEHNCYIPSHCFTLRQLFLLLLSNIFQSAVAVDSSLTNIKYPAVAIHRGGPIIPVCAFQTQAGGRLWLELKCRPVMCTFSLLYDLYFYIIMHALHPSVALQLSEDDLSGHTLLLMNSQADI